MHESATMTMLSAEELRMEQAKTLAAPEPRYGLLATMLFAVMDLLYGRARSWSKFKVLEVIARVPYQARLRPGAREPPPAGQRTVASIDS
jgi:ubiquinol oxidase